MTARAAADQRARPVALITGVSRPGRVGHAIARRLWRDGFDLVLTHRGDDAVARAIADDVRAHVHREGSIDLAPLDLSDLDAVERWARGRADALPRIDALVHNASLYEPTPTDTVDAPTLERFYRVNTLAPLLLSRAMAPRLAESPLPGGGAIVAMCDIHAMGELGQPRRGFVAYELSKAALHELVLVLARELAPRVRVNAVAPGVVAFPTSGHESDKAAQDRYLARVPLARSGTPDEAAAAVAWLIGGATYCTGQVIKVDGGRAVS